MSVRGWLDDESGAVLRFGDVVLDPGTHEVRRGNRRIELGLNEYRLLILFLRYPRQALTREYIFDMVLGYGYPGLYDSVDRIVMRLRDQIEKVDEPHLIQTPREGEYRLEDEMDSR
jgi:two-component system response regulator MprA